MNRMLFIGKHYWIKAQIIAETFPDWISTQDFTTAYTERQEKTSKQKVTNKSRSSESEISRQKMYTASKSCMWTRGKRVKT